METEHWYVARKPDGDFVLMNSELCSGEWTIIKSGIDGEEAQALYDRLQKSQEEYKFRARANDGSQERTHLQLELMELKAQNALLRQTLKAVI